MVDYLHGLEFDIGKNLYNEIGKYTSDSEIWTRIVTLDFIHTGCILLGMQNSTLSSTSFINDDKNITISSVIFISVK